MNHVTVMKCLQKFSIQEPARFYKYWSGAGVGASDFKSVGAELEPEPVIFKMSEQSWSQLFLTGWSRAGAGASHF